MWDTRGLCTKVQCVCHVWRGGLRQTFVGDCTLVPSISLSLYTRLFSNPDAAALRDFMVAAERLVPQ